MAGAGDEPPTIVGLTPYLEVFDMNASLAFYRDLLGFRIVYASPEVATAEGRFPHFVRLGHGEVQFLLNTAYDANQRPPARNEARWSACRHYALYFECEDVPALYAAFAARGLVAEPPVVTAYRYLSFRATDPDGHRVVFHRPL